MTFTFEGNQYQVEGPAIIALPSLVEVVLNSSDSNTRGVWGESESRQRGGTSQKVTKRALVVLGGKVSVAQGPDVEAATKAVEAAKAKAWKEANDAKNKAASLSTEQALEAAFGNYPPAGTAGLLFSSGCLRWYRANGNSQGVAKVDNQGRISLDSSSDRKETEAALKAAGFVF